jgi:hypothetical protein
MNGLVQGLVGTMACVVAFAAGVSFGGRDHVVRLVVPDQVKVEHGGLVSDRAACLDWVASHFDHPVAAQFAMMCAGEK